MVQRKVIVRGATNQALDELDAADIPDLSAAYEAAGGIATHAGLADPHTGYLTPAEGDAAYDALGAAAAAAAASQPLDSDLTAIAALTTTAYGRSFLDRADAAAARTILALGSAALAATGDFDAVGAAAAAQAASQPLDSDLTAIAALTTTAYGRGLLALADAAALAAAHSHGGANSWTTVIKTADESKNSLAVVADDSLLVATLLANTNYVLRLRAFFLTVTAADLKYRLVFTGTTTRVRRRIFRTATTDIAQTIELKTAFDAADVVLCTTGLNPWFEEHVILQVGASGGVFKLQWAQVTSNAGPTTCLEGSYLEYAVT